MPRVALAQESLLDEPLTVSLFISPQYVSEEKFHWHLSINALGKANLIVHTPKVPTSSEFVVPADKMVALRDLVAKEDFFNLKAEYGDEWVAGHPHETVLTIGVGHRVHTVTLGSFEGALRAPSKLTEPARALRVLVAVRALFKSYPALDDTDELLRFIGAEKAYGETEEAKQKANSECVDSLLFGVGRVWTQGIRDAFFNTISPKPGSDPELFSCWMDFIEAGGCMLWALSLEDLERLDVAKTLVVTAEAGSILAVLEFDSGQLVAAPQGGRFAKESEEFRTSVSKLPSNHWVLQFEFDPQTKLLRTWHLQHKQRDLR